MRAVAKRIKAERERQGLSIADLAKTLSVSEKDVLDLENGNNARHRSVCCCP